MTSTISPIACVCLAVTVLAACGSSRDPSSETVAQVGGYAITKAMLNQWMMEKASEDYYDSTGRKSPPRLVSEPADYPACVASLKTITPIQSAAKPKPKLTAAQLTNKCRELYQAVKTQALEYLVSSYWSINFYGAHDIKVTGGESQQGLKRIRAERYPTAGEFQQLLASRRRTLAQELFIVEDDLLAQKIEAKLKHGNRQQSTKLIGEAKKASASAICHPGYVVEYCKGYKAPMSSNTTSPTVLLEEVAL